METTFLVIFTLFLFFQTYGASSNNTMISASSNVTCIQTERQSLLEFRKVLTDESNRLSTWTGVECCEWQGVVCDRRNGHVVKLDLRSPLSFMDDDTLNTNNWLQGKVSPSLFNLKYLRYLDLSMNNFPRQNIPEFFGSFKYLEYLNLSNSGFSGLVPPHLGNLSRLQYLDLNLLDRYEVSLIVKDDLRWVSLLSSLKHLDLSGITISNDIDWFHPVNMLPSLHILKLASCDINISSIRFVNFTSLYSLDLSSNGIDSIIPVWLSNLTSLVHLNLKNNNFHGRIPNFIITLSSLSSIDLSSNQLSGPIPPSLGGLSFLRVLYLYSNQLSGNIPISLDQLSNLQYLDLSSNQLSGGIPESIGLLTRLQELILSSNGLSGNIPNSLGQLSNLRYLYLHNNQLSGVVSEIHFTKLNNLTRLTLSYNSLTFNVSPHWIPPFRLKYFGASYCNIGPHFPSLIQKSTDLEHLDLSHSNITKSMPKWFGNISSHIRYLYLSHNRLGPQFPIWLQTTTNLAGLDLSNSGIIDIIPEWFENISSHIWHIDLSDNQIDGNMPRIKNPGLGILNLGNNLFHRSIATYLYVHKKKRVVVALSISAGSLAMLGLIWALYIWSKRKWRSDTVREGRTVKVLDKDHNSISKNGSTELAVFSLSRITKATDNFSIANRLGEGGFGPVYKGVLEEGLEIAVKRLSKSSRQGLGEFENEVKCIAKLQHRNLVKLLGYCIQRDETMLVYEYMHNKSLDWFIFGDLRKSLLDWPQRFHIIHGIARGLLYLHQDSRLRVVHRDLKAGNILLDCDMNPKISDFGLARMFKGHESEANTKRVVGTLGYISPEYAVNGLFSVKSDIFSFGVLVLEIVSGKKNTSFAHENHHDYLLGYAWRLYKEGKSLDLIDTSLGKAYSVSEVLRSVHIGLLCVQQRAEDRPTTASVVSMLGGEGSLPSPKQPGFFIQGSENASTSNLPLPSSINGVTFTQLEGR